MTGNRSAWDNYWLLPKMLVDLSQRHLQTQILGQSVAMPVLIAPMAFQCLAHREGELEHRFSIQNPVQFLDFGSSQKARFRWLNIRESSFWHY